VVQGIGPEFKPQYSKKEKKELYLLSHAPSPVEWCFFVLFCFFYGTGV
jgi:hypothetical protein